jgi:hypothetical protein
VAPSSPTATSAAGPWLVDGPGREDAPGLGRVSTSTKTAQFSGPSSKHVVLEEVRRSKFYPSPDASEPEQTFCIAHLYRPAEDALRRVGSLSLLHERHASRGEGPLVGPEQAPHTPGGPDHMLFLLPSYFVLPLGAQRRHRLLHFFSPSTPPPPALAEAAYFRHPRPSVLPHRPARAATSASPPPSPDLPLTLPLLLLKRGRRTTTWNPKSSEPRRTHPT